MTTETEHTILKQCQESEVAKKLAIHSDYVGSNLLAFLIYTVDGLETERQKKHCKLLKMKFYFIVFDPHLKHSLEQDVLCDLHHHYWKTQLQ